MITEADIQRIYAPLLEQAELPNPVPFMRRASDRLPVEYENDLEEFIMTRPMVFPELDTTELILED